MKRIVFGCALVFLGLSVFSQNKPDKTILFIPFDSKMYNNQESAAMLPESEMTYEQSIQYFTTSLDEHMTMAIRDSINVYSLLRTYTTDAYNDIDIVHQQADYVLTKRPENLEEKRNLSAVTSIKSRFKKEKEKPERLPNGEIVSVRDDNKDKFVSVKFLDPQVFIDLISNYSAQYVVFITQFEIVGDYSNPYLVGSKQYPRIIRVHYVIFNKNATFITGDVIESVFTAQENNISTICNTYFPKIAKLIAKQLP